MKPTSLQDFYEQTLSVSPDGIAVQMGHFNVFRVKDLNKLKPADAAMFYNRKSFFKIALLVGSTKVKYADTTVDVEESGLLFANPSVPYNTSTKTLRMEAISVFSVQIFFLIRKVKYYLMHFLFLKPNIILFSTFHQKRKKN